MRDFQIGDTVIRYDGSQGVVYTKPIGPRQWFSVTMHSGRERLLTIILGDDDVKTHLPLPRPLKRRSKIPPITTL